MQNIRGIVFVIFSMAVFAGEDAFIKSMSHGIPVSEVLIFLGIGGMVSFATLTFLKRGTLAPLVHRDMRSPLMLWRNASEAVAAMFFITALSLVPLSTVAAVFQATPLAITAGAALFLGEHVGWRRWSAIGAGFIGVLVIIRPGSDTFQLAALLPLGAVITIAIRDLLTRQMDPSIPSLSVAFYGFAAVIPAGLLLAPINDPFVMPSGIEWAYMLGAVICGVSGYYAIVQAMRIAETSIIMPFRYMRLIFSMALGMLVFAERPDFWTYVGATIVIGTGAYTFWREQKTRAR
ncbi:Permease of the drug/metabolite transporter (DMT) superfamily [Aliiroseovarius halocynthiae]|uniref:DMT family transporter n=1 Tax=Aliiroseovarius halocynthiae TaxID=985055 RepID=A0A545SSC7_9RHOB|nr:DMT family transporter [Aliiroseovarius halocynthiae]TQV67878.1 DMT family transporter [Aliiroseovarius halocynthiae]SMR72972.1 Permease of the drug/metabolite transporter (DMT) superfamily [Aliiroseovarius halocynthiae]